MALKLADTQRMVEAGLARAQELGINISIVIVDSGGYLLGAARMDKAVLISPDIAQGKANASALFRQSGTDLGKRWAPGAPVPAAAFARTGGRFVPSQGGLPVWDGDEVVGAVGVSGARSEQDEEVAQAAIDALKIKV
jgi:uncharacterized protein GlcG (DUF336 family)